LCNSEATAASLTSSALLGNARLAASGRTKSLSAQIASSREANSTFCRVQPCLSREVKAKAPLCANSIVDSLLLSLPAPSVKVLSHEARAKALSAKDLNREAKDRAPLRANSEAIPASLKGRTLRSRAKLASKNIANTVALPCEATLSGEAILTSPIAKRKAFKAKPRAS